MRQRFAAIDFEDFGPIVGKRLNGIRTVPGYRFGDVGVMGSVPVVISQARTLVDWGRIRSPVEDEPPIKVHLQQQPHRIAAPCGSLGRWGRVRSTRYNAGEFATAPLSWRRRAVRPLTRLQERTGLLADPLNGNLPFGDVSERPFQLDFFPLQPLQFRLDAAQPLAPRLLSTSTKRPMAARTCATRPRLSNRL
jgi:hypothetical protein